MPGSSLRPHQVKRRVELTQTLRREAPEVKIPLLGMPDLTDDLMACIEVGVVGYLVKEASFGYLLDVIQALHRGESIHSMFKLVN